MLNYTVLSSLYFFQSSSELEGLFDSFFGGLFLVKGLPIFFQMGFLISFLVACLTASHYQTHRSSALKTLCAFASFSGLVFAAFLLFQPWDEVFIFLKHSLNFAETGSFSFNRNSSVEGIVDFLPYFSLGILHKMGVPLLEANFFLGILGGWLCILAGRQILIEMGFQEGEIWSFPLLLVYPPLLLNVSNGFPVLLFSAFVLGSLILLNLKKSWWAGCFVLSIVPLIRIEGLWFCLLSLGAFLFEAKNSLNRRKLILGISLVFLPAICLSVWRKYTFGSPLPTPVIYKAALGNLLYSLFGLRNLLMDLTATGAFLFFWSLFRNKTQRGRLSNFEKLGILLFAFSLPYYFSGGDWFPSAWARYLFPFAYFVFLEGLAWLFSHPSSRAQVRTPEGVALTLLIVLVLFLPFGSIPKLWQELWGHRSTLAGLNRKKGGQSNYRIQQLSQLGTHLARTIRDEEVIGSSEIATIMYFAQRDCLDLLGLTNPEIAIAPLRSVPKLFTKLTAGNELPYLIFKRLKPEVLLKYRPGIFYAFDFFLKDLLKKEDLTKVTHQDLVDAWVVWNENFSRMNLTLFGGVENLLKSGYFPVIVNYGPSFYSLYFVSDEAKEFHFERMQSLGMRLTILTSSRL